MATSLLALPLKIARKIYLVTNPESSAFGRNWNMIPMKEYANDLIYNALTSDRPVMIARLGSNELNCTVNYLGVNFPKKFRSTSNYIKGKSPAWWWESWIMDQMCDVAGFFPKETIHFNQFSSMVISDLPFVDILGSWRKEEIFFRTELSKSKKVMLEDLDPFFTSNPWTNALRGKRVLVVHPFEETIRLQYDKRSLIFPDSLLPDFQLLTLKAVQSHGDSSTRFTDWFEALDWMKNEIEKIDFDICILGCGAYGFPLAAHIKRMGKKAIHLGGVTQLLFGIKGKRWEDYLFYPYPNLFNEHWVRPDDKEKPKNAQMVEGGCYW
jgi:hypothetical protein